MRKSPWLFSSSVRATVMLTLVIWGASAGMTAVIVWLSERTLLTPIAAEIDALETAFFEQIRSDDLEVFPWFDREFDGLFVDDDRLAEGDLEARLGVYVNRLESIPSGDTRVYNAARVRLWLLGDEREPEQIDRPLGFYRMLMLEQFPDDMHDVLFEIFSERERLWPAAWRWETMSVDQRANVLLLALQSGFDERDVCVVDGGGHRPIRATTLVAAGALRGVRVDTEAALGRDPVCWVKPISFDGPREVALGYYADGTVDAVATNRRWRNTGVGLSLLLALALGAWLGRRIYARVRTINQLADKVKRGDLSHRLRLDGSGDDFDRLSENINAMLDRLVRLMDGVKQVSDNIAHDLRSPLTRLRNRIEQVHQKSAPSRDDLSRLAEHADEVLATFTSLLKIAQLENNALRRAFEPVDLNEVIGEVVDLYEPVFADAGVVLCAERPSGPARVLGDRGLWLQVFNNLLENALKYASDSACVRMSIQSAGTDWLVAVHDQGPGVPDHALARLTERFYRAQSHRDTSGSGLGLALVAAITRVHDATLDVSNEGGLRIAMRVAQHRST